MLAAAATLGAAPDRHSARHEGKMAHRYSLQMSQPQKLWDVPAKGHSARTLEKPEAFDDADPSTWPAELFHPTPSFLFASEHNATMTADAAREMMTVDEARKQHGPCPPGRQCGNGDLYPGEEHHVMSLRAGMASARERNCFDLLTRYKSFVVHNSGVLWCPAAKTGSSSIVTALELDRLHRGSLVTAAKLTVPQKQRLCQSRHFTFTMTRDPYDRLASAYIDKVVMELGDGCAEARNRLRNITHPTFTNFIDVLSQMAPRDHDPHTYPYSLRCGTDKYQYDLLARLGDFDDAMKTVFSAMSLGEYRPVQEKNLGTQTLSPQQQRRIADFNLRPDLLQLHGSERVEYFYTPHTKEVVEKGIWKDDVAQFAEYIKPDKEVVPGPSAAARAWNVGQYDPTDA
jgi:hypothetical protein